MVDENDSLVNVSEDETITMDLPEDLLIQLQAMALEKGMALEDLVAMIINEVMQDEIQKAIDSGQATEDDFVPIRVTKID